MPSITRDQFLAGLSTVKTIQSVTWHRRVKKIVHRCVNCEAETATHEGERFCNACNAFVATYQSTEAEQGDIVRMQFIPRINPNGTKNWTPAGGYMFNAPTREAAEAIKREKGLFQCLKMSEQVPADANANELARLVASGDLPSVPRCFGVDDVKTWAAEGQVYTIE